MLTRSSAAVLTAICVCVLCATYLLSDHLKTVCSIQTAPRLATTNGTVHQTSAPPAPSQLRPKLLFKGEFTGQMTENMQLDVADSTYYNFLFHLHYTCEDYYRPGNVVDGGWDICLVEPYALQKPCLVYSFGINWDFSFDDAVSMKFGCTIRAFDPSMDKAADHRRGANIWFYKLGLGDSDTVTPNGWKIKTLQSIVNHLNDTGKIIDYLKIDVDDNEWKSLEAMYTSDILTRVKQFGIEIHTMPIGLRDTKAFYYRWKILKRLEDDFGFRRWYWHFNHWGAYHAAAGGVKSCCYELVYININFLPASQHILRPTPVPSKRP